MILQHSFDIDVATKYGVHSAILFNHLAFWIAKNEANEVNFYDGNYWTFNSRQAFSRLFPYMTPRQITYALDKLIEAELIVTGNYNNSAYDRTLWYGLTDKGKSILQNCQMETPKNANRNAEIVKPIPNINTGKSTNKNTDKIIKVLDKWLNDHQSNITAEQKERLTKSLLGFADMRKDIKKPLSERATLLIIDKANTLAGASVERMALILDQSTMHSWQGVFALKEASKPAPTAPSENITEYPF